MKELKKFDAISVGGVLAVFGFILSIFQMIVIKLIHYLNPVVALEYGFDASKLTFGIMLGSIVFATAAYFICGYLSALIYNLSAKYIGGIKIDVEEAKSKFKSKKKK